MWVMSNDAQNISTLTYTIERHTHVFKPALKIRRTNIHFADTVAVEHIYCTHFMRRIEKQ